MTSSEKFYSIYKITCIINQKSYIGFSYDPRMRWEQHKKASEKEKTKNVFYRAIKKYGWDNFRKEIIYVTPSFNHIKEMEIYFIEFFHSHISKNGYNMTLGGLGGDTISKHPNLKKLKQNWSLKGKGKNIKKSLPGSKNGMYGVHRFGELNPMYDHVQKESTKKLISKKAKERYELGFINPLKGTHLTEKHKQLIRENNCRNFEFIDPLGNKILIHNLTKFCRDHNLNPCCMTHVYHGRNKTHKGYTKYH